MPARARSRASFVGATVALLLLTTGPLFQIRSWWGYDDPLGRDPVVVLVHAAAGTVAAAWLARHVRLLPQPPLVAAGALVAWLLASAAWSEAPATTLREGLQIASALAVGIAARLALGDRRFLAALWLALHVGLAWSFVAIYTTRPGSQDEHGDWAGIYFNRNSLALYAALGILVGVVIALGAVRRRSAGARAVLALAGAGVAFDAVLLAGSGARTPLLALVAAAGVVAVVIVLHRPARRGVEARSLAAGAGLGLAGAAVAAWASRGLWLDELGRPTDLSSRVELWDVAVARALERPVLGHGYLALWQDAGFVAAVERATDHRLMSAHNVGVDVFLGAGAVGLGALAVFVALLWLGIVAPAVARPSLAALAATALAVFLVVENLAETLFVGNQLAVALLGALAAAGAAGDADDVATAPRRGFEEWASA